MNGKLNLRQRAISDYELAKKKKESAIHPSSSRRPSVHKCSPYRDNVPIFKDFFW